VRLLTSAIPNNNFVLNARVATDNNDNAIPTNSINQRQQQQLSSHSSNNNRMKNTLLSFREICEAHEADARNDSQFSLNSANIKNFCRGTQY